jgi:hypothetical protein
MIDFDGEIKPPIKFKKEEKEIPSGEALLIKGLNELVDYEDFTSEERLGVLTHLNALLKEKASCPYFLCYLELVGISTIESVCVKIAKHLKTPENEIAKTLHKQIKNKLDFESFIEKCRQANIRTIIVGGVYGDACVWVAAAQLAKNIYAKNLGSNHPNVRYIENESGYQFESAIILPQLISLGQKPERVKLYSFDQFLCFPQTNIFETPFTPGFFEKAQDKLRHKKPDEVGITYEDYAPSTTADDHQLIVDAIKETLKAEDRLTSRNQLKEEKLSTSPLRPGTFSTAKSPIIEQTLFANKRLRISSSMHEVTAQTMKKSKEEKHKGLATTVM